MAIVKLTKEQKAEAKSLLAMRKLAIKVKRKFPEFTVKYSPWDVTLCLGWDWDENKKLVKIADRADRLFNKDCVIPGKARKPGSMPVFGVAADTSGGCVRTVYASDLIVTPKA